MSHAALMIPVDEGDGYVQLDAVPSLHTSVLQPCVDV